MKRIIVLALCMAMLLSASVTAVAQETVFNSNTDTSTALFLISGSNKAGQEFVAGFTSLQGIKVYLNNEVAGNAVTVAVYQGSAAVEDCVLLYTEELSLTGTGYAWYELTFSQAVTVEADALCSFTLNAKERAVWNGTATGEGTYKALNYDKAAYGGWVRGNVAAFELVARYEGEQPSVAVDRLIAALPDPITLADAPQVAEARAAYDALPIAQRAYVTNYNKLTAAEQTLAELQKQEEQKALQAVQDAIAAIGTVTAQSRQTIITAQTLANAYAYENGVEALDGVENYSQLAEAIAAYNRLVDYRVGDVSGDEVMDASDALAVLKHAVGKQDFTETQRLSADVNGDTAIDASDALMILQYSVNKIDSFPAQATQPEPIEEELPLYSQKNAALFAATYQSMIDRTQENGYAQTSITGAYPGMFCRDSSIQIMAHVAAGDYDQAAKLLQYILDYHKTYEYSYVIHIMNNGADAISYTLQTDTTFFFLHAWYLYATQADDTPEKAAFLARSEEQIKGFADYFLKPSYWGDNDLLRNPSLEHSREGRYWDAYDLLTNTYASQAWHELSLYFAQNDPQRAAAWSAAADRITAGVHQNLTDEIDGKRFYAELIDIENDNAFVRGFSWVNLAPMGCDWYGADPEILENTYQLYMTYGSCVYYGKYKMLDVVSTYNGRPLTRGNHVIGKGLAWEMMYCKKMGYTQRLATLVSFIENNSNEMYRETWGYTGGGSDTANQEHASWMLYAHATCFPELKELCKE